MKALKTKRTGCYVLTLLVFEEVYRLRILYVGEYPSGVGVELEVTEDDVDYFASAESWLDSLSTEDRVFKLLARDGYDEFTNSHSFF